MGSEESKNIESQGQKGQGGAEETKGSGNTYGVERRLEEGLRVWKESLQARFTWVS